MTDRGHVWLLTIEGMAGDCNKLAFDNAEGLLKHLSQFWDDPAFNEEDEESTIKEVLFGDWESPEQALESCRKWGDTLQCEETDGNVWTIEFVGRG